LIGIGNSGRSDDGLGWKFLELVAAFNPGDAVYRYQLQIEDAELISDYDMVIFVDASSKAIPGGFSMTRCPAQNTISFSSHRIDPSSIVWLCQELYGRSPEAWVMAIEGKDFELRVGLSGPAEQNVAHAVECFEKWLPANLVTASA
jgi:hydrogenase maturation protease